MEFQSSDGLTTWSEPKLWFCWELKQEGGPIGGGSICCWSAWPPVWDTDRVCVLHSLVPQTSCWHSLSMKPQLVPEPDWNRVTKQPKSKRKSLKDNSEHLQNFWLLGGKKETMRVGSGGSGSRAFWASGSGSGTAIVSLISELFLSRTLHGVWVLCEWEASVPGSKPSLSTCW